LKASLKAWQEGAPDEEDLASVSDLLVSLGIFAGSVRSDDQEDVECGGGAFETRD
jgi:hypothetical protein